MKEMPTKNNYKCDAIIELIKNDKQDEIIRLLTELWHAFEYLKINVVDNSHHFFGKEDKDLKNMVSSLVEVCHISLKELRPLLDEN